MRSFRTQSTSTEVDSSSEQEPKQPSTEGIQTASNSAGSGLSRLSKRHRRLRRLLVPGSILTLRLKLSAVVSWRDIQVFVLPGSGGRAPRPVVPPHLDSLWTFSGGSGEILCWASTSEGWKADGGDTTPDVKFKVLSPEAQRVLHIPGATNITVGTKITTTMTAKSVVSDVSHSTVFDPSEAPEAKSTDGHHSGDDSHELGLHSVDGATTKTTPGCLSITRGPLKVDLSAGSLDIKLAPVAFSTSATLEVIDLFKRAINQRGARIAAQNKTQQPRKAKSKNKAAMRYDVFQLIDRINIGTGELRVLHALPGPKSGATELGPESEQEEVAAGSVVVGHTSAITAKLEDFDPSEKQHRLARWAQGLTRLTRREQHGVRDMTSSFNVDEIEVHVYSATPDALIQKQPVGQMKNIAARAETRIFPKCELDPVVCTQLTVGHILGQWHLPPQAADDPLSQGCTALVASILYCLGKRRATKPPSSSRAQPEVEPPVPHASVKRKGDELLGKLAEIVATKLVVELRAGLRVNYIDGVLSTKNEDLTTSLCGFVEGTYANITLLPSTVALESSYATVLFDAGVPRISVDLSQQSDSGSTARAQEYSCLDVIASSAQGELKATISGWQTVSSSASGERQPSGPSSMTPHAMEKDEAARKFGPNLGPTCKGFTVPLDMGANAVRSHLEGSASGSVRAVRARLDDPIAWGLLQRLAAGVGRLAGIAREAKDQAPSRPPKVSRGIASPKGSAEPAAESTTTYVHTHHLYASLSVLDFDGRCASLDPKRNPNASGPHAYEGIPCARPEQIKDDSRLPKMNQQVARHRATLDEQTQKDAESVYVGQEGDVHAKPQDEAEFSTRKNPDDMSAAEKAEIVATVPPSVPPLAQQDIVDDHSALTAGQRKAKNDVLDAEPTPRNGSSFPAYHLPEFCPPLPPAKAGVTGLRAICPRWRVEAVAIQTILGQDTKVNDANEAARSELGLEQDTLDICVARAQSVGRSFSLRSTVFDYALAAVDPVPARGERKTRHGAGPEVEEGPESSDSDAVDTEAEHPYGSHRANAYAETDTSEDAPDVGSTGEKPDRNPHGLPEQKPFEIMHAPRSVVSVDISPPDDQDKLLKEAKQQICPAQQESTQVLTVDDLPDPVIIGWHNPRPNVVSIELANTYALLMVISGFRSVLEAAKVEIQKLTTPESSTSGLNEEASPEDEDEAEKPDDSQLPNAEPKEVSPLKLKRKIEFVSTFARIDVPILLPNGLRVYLGLRRVKHGQTLWWPLPKFGKSKEDEVHNSSAPAPGAVKAEVDRHGLTGYHIEFDQLLTAVYRRKMGLWKPLRDFEWAEFLSWNRGFIHTDWPAMLFPAPGNWPAPWDGATVHWDETNSSMGTGGETKNEDMPESAPNIQGYTNAEPKAPPAKRWPHILLAGDSLLMTIPVGFIFHDIVTGASLGVKATKQLVNEAVKGDLDFQLKPSVMKPLPLPPMRLRLRSLVIEFEDNPIDSHLVVAQQASAVASKSRLSREVAFHKTTQDNIPNSLFNSPPSSGHNEVEEQAKVKDFLLAAAETPAGGYPAGRPQSDSKEARPSAWSCNTKFSQSFDSLDSLSSLGTALSTEASTRESDERHEAIQAYLATVKSARQALDQYESTEWIKMIHRADDDMHKTESRSRRALENPVPAQVLQEREKVERTKPDYGEERGCNGKWLVRMRSYVPKSPLFRSVMTHVDLRVSQPHTFTSTDESARGYINTFGDPIPKGMEFSIFIPIHLELDMEEWLATLRDYPLPLIHVIPDQSGPFFPRAPLSTSAYQTRTPTFQLATEMVITEQMGYEPSTHYLAASIVHHNCEDDCGQEYVLQIPKVTMPSKIFGHPVARIRSKNPLQLAWGQSMSPALSEVSKVIDGFSSIPIDPSPKLGFWDKLPLILHGDFELLIDESSSAQLFLKGSRNPYDVRSFGAGWVKIWSQGVRCTVNKPNDAREVIQILSGEYKLAIPDLNVMASPASVSLVTLGTTRDKHEVLDIRRPSMTAEDEVVKDHRSDEKTYEILYPPLALQKIAWGLRGDVTWGAGFLLERTCDKYSCRRESKCDSPIPFYRKCRLWNQVSHWTVINRTPQYIESLPKDANHDSFSGWRHDHVHFSLSVKSRAVNVDNPNRANSLHVTPLTSAHFWAWIHLFNSALSLPIRLGPLYGELPAQSAGFGKHCATIKYRFDIKPFFASHVYLQHDTKRHQRGANLFIGLKVRVDEFEFDVHQRQQETFVENKALGTTQKTLHKPVNTTGLDLTKGEMRVIAAEVTDLARAARAAESGIEEESVEDSQGPDAFLDGGSDESTDETSGWWDYRDFVELGTRIGRDPEARSTIARTETIVSCPAFSYFRKTRTRKEIEETVRADKAKAEEHQDLSSIQRIAIESSRYANLGAYGDSKFGDERTHFCLMSGHKDSIQTQAELVYDRIKQLRGSGSVDKGKSEAVQILEEFAESLQPGSNLGNRTDKPMSDHPHGHNGDRVARKMRDIADTWDRFNNRYTFHCPVVTFNNSTRNILYRYYCSNRLRRGQAHFLRAAALQSIRSLHMGKGNESKGKPTATQAPEDAHLRDSSEQDTSAQNEGVKLLRALLDKTVNVFEQNNSSTVFGFEDGTEQRVDLQDVYRGINSELEVRLDTILLLLRPQFILQSEIDDKSTLVLSASRMRMSNFAVFDPNFIDSDVNARIFNRNIFTIEQLKGWWPKDKVSFPLPMETLINERDQQRGERDDNCRQITTQTNFVMQYDHFNQLRLSTDASRIQGTEDFPKDQEHLLYHMDMVRVLVPPFTIAADRDQYAAIFNVCMDLLLYQDPAQKQRQDRLNTLLLAYDFDDSESLARVVAALQLRIGVLYQMHEEFEGKYGDLTEEGRINAGETFGEMRDLISELSLFMDAIKAAQDQRAGHDEEQRSALMLEVSIANVIWRMLKTEDKDLPLTLIDGPSSRIAELHVEKWSFSWLNKADFSTANALSITDVSAHDPRPDAIFPSILAKFKSEETADHHMARNGRFLEAVWHMLAPVAGISIIDRFELDVHPLDVQLELDVGREIMDYAFPRRNKESQEQIEDAESDEETESKDGISGSRFKLFGRDRDDSTAQTESDDDSVDTRSSARTRPPSMDTQSSSPARKSRTGPFGRRSKQTEEEAAHSAETEEVLFGDMDDLDDDTMRVAAVMRDRAQNNTTYVYVRLPHTIFRLSFRGDNKLIDMYGSVFQTPAFEFGNTTCAVEDLVDHFKKSVIQAAWNQKSTIIKGFLRYRPHHVSKRLSLRKKLRKQAERARTTRGMIMSDIDRSDSEESSFPGATPSENGQDPSASLTKRLATLEEEPHRAHTSNRLSGRDESRLEHSTSTNSLSRINTARPSAIEQHPSDAQAEVAIHGNTSHLGLTNDHTKSKASLSRHPSSSPSSSPSSTKKKHRISKLFKSAFHTGS